MALTAPHATCWLDGAFLPLSTARISPLDRGFLFGDAVYEVLPCYAGRPFLFHPHMARLERSLRELGLALPAYPRERWAQVLRGLVAHNDVQDATLYLQVSRGAEWGRNHAPPGTPNPTVFAYATPLPPLDPKAAEEGVSAATFTDERWARCDIKSTALLANVMAKGRAQSAGAFEAVLLSGGKLREGSSTSVLIIQRGVLVAPPDGPHLLPGTTRDLVFRLAQAAGVPVERREVSEAELRAADEVLLCFATRGTLPVTKLDGRPIGGDLAAGRPGPVWQRLNSAFHAHTQELAGTPFDAPDPAYPPP